MATKCHRESKTSRKAFSSGLTEKLTEGKPPDVAIPVKKFNDKSLYQNGWELFDEDKEIVKPDVFRIHRKTIGPREFYLYGHWTKRSGADTDLVELVSFAVTIF